MHIVITGANGFVGRALARRIQREGRLGEHVVTRLSLPDLNFDGPEEGAGVVRRHAGNLADSVWLREVLDDRRLDAIFHLASVPGGTAEHYALARAVNLDATLDLLEVGKAQVEAGGRAPVFVFASSIAVFGAMPDRVTDDTPLRPQMTYGTQKLVQRWHSASAPRATVQNCA